MYSGTPTSLEAIAIVALCCRLADNFRLLIPIFGYPQSSFYLSGTFSGLRCVYRFNVAQLSCNVNWATSCIE